MNARIVAAVAAGVLVVAAIWRPAPRPAGLTVEAGVSPSPPRRSARREHERAGTALLVYVVGAVRRPGLYRLSGDPRAGDAVAAAGGMLPGADPAGVNLAAHAQDGDEIDVPIVGQAPVRGVRRRPSRVKGKTPLAAPVDVNTAGESALAAVPGIGAAIAARIVEVRERDGAYQSLDELLDVAGMTPARLDRASPYLVL